MIHRWNETKAQGDVYEAEQDAIWKKWYHITPATRDEDRQGIDRHFEAKACPIKFTMQYKGDDRASSSGNLFIEVISIDCTGDHGWAIRCAADYLSIYIPDERYCYWIYMPHLKVCVPWWLTRFPIAKADNDGYQTHGILVPRKVVEVSWCCHGVYKEGVLRASSQLSFGFPYTQ